MNIKSKLKKILYRNEVKDALCILAFVLVYLLIILIKTHGGKYVLGSTTDFDVQHYTLPDYLRTLFYDTGDLFPDFSMHLGGGQNIYHISYYGLLNPVILLSYLFPFADMLTYITVAMAIAVLSSVILFYFFLKKNRYSRTVSFICAFLLLCAAPLIFHSHRHIMFVSYMPFLMLGLYGIDRFIDKKKSLLLIVSVTLMIFTSYYFSIPGMLTLFVYGLFRFVRQNGFSCKQVILKACSLFLRLLCSVLMAGILVLPTLAVLLSGRGGSGNALSIIDLLLPKMYMLYSPYSMGLTVITLLGTVYMLFSKRIENKILCTFLLLVSVFPVCSYVLNAFLYVNGKSLIPLIPLVLINTADFLTDVLARKKSFGYKRLVSAVLAVLCFASPITLVFFHNGKEKLMTDKETFAAFESAYAQSVADTVAYDGGYRINSSLLDKIYINKVVNAKEYKSTVYASSFNDTYRRAYRELFGNPLNIRNEFVISASENLIFQMYMGEKYLYSTHELGYMYEEVDRFGDIILYRNPYALPIGYATDRVIDKKQFDKLTYPANMLSMLGTAVVDDRSTTHPIVPQALNDPGFSVVKEENLHYRKSKNGYTVNAADDGSITLRLNDSSLQGKLLFIDFNVQPAETDLSVSINRIENLLTAKDWKYYNHNTNFAYVIPNSDNLLHVSFTKGEYVLSDISVYCLDFNKIKHINKKIDPFVIDAESTQADVIAGSIDVTTDSYFMLSVPYDKGFTVLVDGKETEYFMANGAFIGFEITKGHHTVSIHYKAPLKTEGWILSSVGIVLSVTVIGYELYKRKRKK